MQRYLCPYCNSKFNISKGNKSRQLICDFCGEDLIKKPAIRIQQIVALISAISFLLPIFYLLYFLINNQKNQNEEKYISNITYLTKDYIQPLQRDFFKQELKSL